MRRSGWLVVAVVGLVAGLAGLAQAGGLLSGLDERAWDRMQPAVDADGDVVVVAIDGATLARSSDGWPWPRDVHADLVNRLWAAGARVIAYDVVFADPSTADDRLAEALAQGPSVLAADFAATGTAPTGMLTGPVLRPTGVLADAAQLIGHVAVVESPNDRIVRSVPAVVEADDRSVVPALGLAASLVDQAATAVTVRQSAVQVGERIVPTEGDHLVRLAFSSGVPVVSAAALFGGSVGDDLAGRMVFVGVTEPSIGEELGVPTGEVSPGTVVQAELAGQVARGVSLRPLGDTTRLLWVVVLAAAGGVAMYRPRLRVALVIVVLCGLGGVVIAAAAFEQGTLMPIVWPLVALGTSAFATLSVRWFGGERQRRRVEQLFSSYIPDQVASRLLAHESLDAELEGHRRRVAVVFCDVRGFTATSATMDPAAVARWIEMFWEEMTDVIFEHGGTVLNYSGDEVFAVWGAPVEVAAPGAVALNAALAMQDRTPALARRHERAGFPPVAFGIGVHEGPVVAAHLGPPRRRQYTVFGDTVNVGARLCSAAGRGEVVASGVVVESATGISAEEILGVALKGVDEQFRLFRVERDAP